MYVVIENTPGYLPDDDDPATFEDYSSAVEYMKDRIEEYREHFAECDIPCRIEEGYASQDNLAAAMIYDDSKTYDLGRWIQIVLDEDCSDE